MTQKNEKNKFDDDGTWIDGHNPFLPILLG